MRGDFAVSDSVCRDFFGRDDIGAMQWSWPGRVSVTYGEVVRLCRARGWPRPELTPARIVRRAETEEDDHGQ